MLQTEVVEKNNVDPTPLDMVIVDNVIHNLTQGITNDDDNDMIEAFHVLR